MKYEKVIGLLGLKGKDKITGFNGIVTSICFDLFGCIQVILSHSVDKDGKEVDSRWLDVNRIVVESKKPVMECPDFCNKYKQLLDVNGPARKPVP
jgi:hypothetical protein